MEKIELLRENKIVVLVVISEDVVFMVEIEIIIDLVVIVFSNEEGVYFLVEKKVVIFGIFNVMNWEEVKIRF